MYIYIIIYGWQETNILHKFTPKLITLFVMKLYEDEDEQWINENCVKWRCKQNMYVINSHSIHL